MPKAKIVSADQAAALPTLELTTLGRPFHLLPLFARRLEAELAEFFELTLNRRYRAGFTVGALTQARPPADQGHGYWFDSGNGLLAASVERPLLLAVLDYRFGVKPQPGAAGSAPLPAVTETERRLARMLAEHLLPCISRAIDSLDPALAAPPAGHALQALDYTPAQTPAWQVVVSVSDAQGGSCGSLRLALDHAAFDRLLKVLSRRRELKGAAHHALPLPFVEQVRVRLAAQLMEKRLTLGEVFALKPGSVLPVTLSPRADVYIGTARIYSADVAEHQGRLCLTGFTDCDAAPLARA